jgi:putative RecB family exonuclease
MGRVDQSTKGLMPTDEDIDEYFTEVETSLLAHGIRAISPETRDHTLKLIQAFNRIEGPILYPRIIDTEHRLQSERGEYLLYGVVDVLASSERPLGSSGTEIWDYKGTRKPKAKRVAGSRRLRDYEFQMQVYSELYRQRNGNHPQRAVIYFIGELAGEPSKRPEDAMMTVNLDLVRIQNALVEFDTTVKAIRTCIEEDEWIPPTEGAGKETCDLCDTRWSCPSIGHQYREHRRYP